MFCLCFVLFRVNESRCPSGKIHPTQPGGPITNSVSTICPVFIVQISPVQPRRKYRWSRPATTRFYRQEISPLASRPALRSWRIYHRRKFTTTIIITITSDKEKIVANQPIQSVRVSTETNASLSWPWWPAWRLSVVLWPLWPERPIGLIRGNLLIFRPAKIGRHFSELAMVVWCPVDPVRPFITAKTNHQVLLHHLRIRLAVNRLGPANRQATVWSTSRRLNRRKNEEEVMVVAIHRWRKTWRRPVGRLQCQCTHLGQQEE